MGQERTTGEGGVSSQDLATLVNMHRAHQRNSEWLAEALKAGLSSDGLRLAKALESQSEQGLTKAEVASLHIVQRLALAQDSK
jgi:hypothetical protein